MITGFLSLLCLGLCLGYDDEHKNDTLPRPSLHALPGSVVGRGGNVTLKCQGHLQNVTFMLGKWQDPGYRRERSSAGHGAEFLLTRLEPEHAGRYFCAYKTAGSHGWSEKSEHLRLEVTDNHDRPGASSAKTAGSSSSPPSAASPSSSSSPPSSSSTGAVSTAHPMKNPPRELAIPSKRPQICPSRKAHRSRLKTPRKGRVLMETARHRPRQRQLLTRPRTPRDLVTAPH
ncbi:V-set and transmembrane domain-containing protein 1 isoform X2 [Eptesicus fuscus]|uniref:V-set and transmembrane domain-containing protein 1 isoform X2 n=1 Tax=Eptesicus fuscus TaxID=29078 RepID=UPI0024043FEA|nr:V-set and transmembrane domain-containing protein 1 isoform X2 [Eptesicus fuscus]